MTEDEFLKQNKEEWKAVAKTLRVSFTKFGPNIRKCEYSHVIFYYLHLHVRIFKKTFEHSVVFSLVFSVVFWLFFHKRGSSSRILET